MHELSSFTKERTLHERAQQLKVLATPTNDKKVNGRKPKELDLENKI
ncbi:hypothetical protein [Companilactobacillus ginsenosidimutans]|nr:hypothetical protein [Companilactobacillus ginsenosidimutans]